MLETRRINSFLHNLSTVFYHFLKLLSILTPRTAAARCTVLLLAFSLFDRRKALLIYFAYFLSCFSSWESNGALNFFTLSLSTPFIELDSWLAGCACRQNSAPNLWRKSRLLIAVVNPYSSEAVEFSATTLSVVEWRRVVHCVRPKVSHDASRRKNALGL